MDKEKKIRDSELKKIKKEYFLINKMNIKGIVSLLAGFSIFAIFILVISIVGFESGYEEGYTEGYDTLNNEIYKTYDSLSCGEYFILSNYNKTRLIYKNCINHLDIGVNYKLIGTIPTYPSYNTKVTDKYYFSNATSEYREKGEIG